MACNNLLALGRAYNGAKCLSCIDPRISWRCVDPRRIVDYNAVFCLWYNRGVSLPFVKVGGLQDCKCPAQLVFKGVDRFGHDDACNLCDGVLLGDEHVIMLYFFDNFVDIVVPSSLVEIEDAQCCCKLAISC